MKEVPLSAVAIATVPWGSLRTRPPKMAIRKQYSAKDEFPNLSKHHNILSKVLTLDMYERLSSLTSKSGYTLDKCIQTGEFANAVTNMQLE